MKKFNKDFSISTEGMENGNVLFNFKISRNKFGQIIQAVNEIRYSVTAGDKKIWTILPPSMLLSFISSGFESGIETFFQHRVTTIEGIRSEWSKSLKGIL